MAAAAWTAAAARRSSPAAAHSTQGLTPPLSTAGLGHHSRTWMWAHSAPQHVSAASARASCCSSGSPLKRAGKAPRRSSRSCAAAAAGRSGASVPPQNFKHSSPSSRPSSCHSMLRRKRGCSHEARSRAEGSGGGGSGGTFERQGAGGPSALPTCDLARPLPRQQRQPGRRGRLARAEGRRAQLGAIKGEPASAQSCRQSARPIGAAGRSLQAPAQRHHVGMLMQRLASAAATVWRVCMHSTVCPDRCRGHASDTAGTPQGSHTCSLLWLIIES